MSLFIFLLNGLHTWRGEVFKTHRVSSEENSVFLPCTDERGDEIGWIEPPWQQRTVVEQGGWVDQDVERLKEDW